MLSKCFDLDCKYIHTKSKARYCLENLKEITIYLSHANISFYTNFICETFGSIKPYTFFYGVSLFDKSFSRKCNIIFNNIIEIWKRKIEISKLIILFIGLFRVYRMAFETDISLVRVRVVFDICTSFLKLLRQSVETTCGCIRLFLI